jgi:hypothetical protein
MKSKNWYRRNGLHPMRAQRVWCKRYAIPDSTIRLALTNIDPAGIFAAKGVVFIGQRVFV